MEGNRVRGKRQLEGERERPRQPGRGDATRERVEAAKERESGSSQRKKGETYDYIKKNFQSLAKAAEETDWKLVGFEDCCSTFGLEIPIKELFQYHQPS